MSQTGEIVFYSAVEPADPRGLLLRFLESLGIEKVFDAWRTKGVECGWDYLERNRRATGDEVYQQPIEYLEVRGLKLIDVVELYLADRYLRIDVGPLGSGGYGNRVSAAIRDEVPPEVRGNFNPGAMYLGVGYHDLFEAREDEDTTVYIARAFFSVSFFGYGTPRDWPEMRRVVFHAPGIVRVKRDLEAMLGPLQECIYWNV